MELLRIVAMLMVLVVHCDGAALGLPGIAGGLCELDARSSWQLAVESLAIIGVNCFTLISGYFGIRLSMAGVGRYLYQCLFYSVGIASAGLFLFPLRVTWDAWLDSWLVLSHTDLWYVPAYFGLMLVSPILNKGVEGLSPRQLLASTTGFIAFNLWCGWWMGGRFNPTGYTLVQLIMVYIIGRSIGRCVSLEWIRSHRGVLWLCYMVSTIAIFVMSIYMNPTKAFAYNSPAVLAASVALLTVFLGYSFQSRMVNYVAKSAFAVYLLHKAPLMWTEVMKPQVVAWWDGSPLWLFSLRVAGLCALIYAVAMVVDSLRRRLVRVRAEFRR